MLLLLGLMGCGDDSMSMPGEPTAGVPAAGTGAAQVSFASEVMPNIIVKACNCHQTEPILMAPISLKVGEAYDNLVGVPSEQLTTMNLVEPGSLNASYLWHKLNDTHLEVGGSGLRMPSTIPLDAADIDLVGRWIAGGAGR